MATPTRCSSRLLYALAGLGAAGVGLPLAQALAALRAPKVVVAVLALDGPVGHDGIDGAAHLVWLGDSTAAGVGADDADGALPRQVAAQLGRPVDLTVLARSGARVADVVATQLPRLAALARRPDVVLISVGANDVAHLTRVSDFARQYRALLDALEGVATVVLGIPDMHAARVVAQPLRSAVGLRARVLDARLRRIVAARPGVSYTNLAGRPSPTLAERVGDYLCADRYHPNAHGYRVWAALVTERLGEHLALPGLAMAAAPAPAAEVV